MTQFKILLQAGVAVSAIQRRGYSAALVSPFRSGARCKDYRVPAVAPCWDETNHARSCREKGLPGAHTSSKLNPNKPAGLAAGTGSSSAGSEGPAKTALQGKAPRGTSLSPTRSLSALLHAPHPEPDRLDHHGAHALIT